MSFEAKVDWLERVFSNDVAVRQQAMDERLPEPLFETHEEFINALKELEVRRTKSWI